MLTSSFFNIFSGLNTNILKINKAILCCFHITWMCYFRLNPYARLVDWLVSRPICHYLNLEKCYTSMLVSVHLLSINIHRLPSSSPWELSYNLGCGDRCDERLAVMPRQCGDQMNLLQNSVKPFGILHKRDSSVTFSTFFLCLIWILGHILGLTMSSMLNFNIEL